MRAKIAANILLCGCDLKINGVTKNSEFVQYMQEIRNSHEGNSPYMVADILLEACTEHPDAAVVLQNLEQDCDLQGQFEFENFTPAVPPSTEVH